jgi:hypothetical protein
VQDYAAAQGARTDDRDRLQPRAVDGLYPRTFVSVHKAVLSPDATEALIYIDATSGPLAGGGFLAFYQRDVDSSWRRIAFLPLWVS